ncbi:MAG: rod shape-determining protein MreD [Rhodobacteraceae bacterium]|nr:rod shape-determining protein MreD [Alphaproteobacteria bacterium]MBT8473969.1 rod shape-determining protein MreD [Alphaproteobacteria bacterium]NNK65505.1 rod shape-determining protein MreD [Paracoccaceae bacterium]
MAETIVTRRWRYRAIFAALAFIVIFARLLPLDAGPGGLPGPDLVLLLAFAWVLRRPDYVPVVLVAVVMLLMDVLFLRPLGLWAACTVLALEFLRSREAGARDLPFLFEWVLVGGVIVMMTLGNMLILALFAVSQPPLGLLLIQMIMTILSYPLVVLFSAKGLGLKKMSPGAVDQLGHKL